MDRLRKIVREIHRRSLWQILGVYLVASWGALEAVQGLTEVASLPGWLPALALALLIVGLPIVLATAFVQEGVSDVERPREEPTPDTAAVGVGADTSTSLRRLLTWRNAFLGGLGAFALWGLVATVLLLSDRTSPDGGVPDSRPSLAVLPFENLSPDPDNDYFAAGIHEEILTHLSRVEGMKLISRTSVLRYEDTDKSLRQIGDELGVSSILEGTVQRADDRVRITTQLIDAETDEHLWAERYDRELSDIFSIQTDVATRIVEELRGVLTEEEEADLARRPTDDLEAYASYLKGHQHFRRLHTLEEARAAEEAYAEAVKIDPEFSAAWARLVFTRLWLAWVHGDLDEREKARAALEQLEATDPGSEQARMAWGYWLYYGAQRYEDALREFEALADLRPGDMDVRAMRGALYRRLGRWDEAVREQEGAFELDPAHPAMAVEVAQTFEVLRRWDDAESYAERAVSLDPESSAAWASLWRVRISMGDTAGARALADSIVHHVDEASGNDLRARSALLFGRPGTALELLLAREDRGFAVPERVLRAATAAGRPDLVPAYADTLRIRAERELDRPHAEHRAERSHNLADLALAHAHLGNDQEAVRLADEALELMPVSHDALNGARRLARQAEVYTLVGRHDDAVRILRRLLSIPSFITVPLLRMDPRWDPLRDRSGFRKLVTEG